MVLIGLAAKNAILIVEFAQQGFLDGKSATEAALNAARLRFRPIVMTSLAFVLGVMPLMLATGAGAGARRSMGTGVVGGMLAATFIATIFIPLFFVIVSRAQEGAAKELRLRKTCCLACSLWPAASRSARTTRGPRWSCCRRSIQRRRRRARPWCPPTGGPSTATPR